MKDKIKVNFPDQYKQKKTVIKSMNNKRTNIV